jgi:hypothetical protein
MIGLARRCNKFTATCKRLRKSANVFYYRLLNSFMHIKRWRLKKFRNYPADAKKSCSRREKLQEPLMTLQISVVNLIQHEPICAASRE